jgi:HAE1 family hydrophobic/amphiphilic exporter-1
MGLTRLAIKRPLTMLMIILGLVVLGYRSLTMLQVDRLPKMDLPYVSVVTVFPGASPEDVEDQVIKPIEDAVAGIAGIDHINSNANEGLGVVIISFVEGVNGDQAAINVERQVAAVRSTLPSDAQDPSIIKADANASALMQVVLNGPQGEDELYDIAENQIKPRLQAVDGVASVSVSGGREREIQVYPDPDRLAAFDLSLGSIQQALVANNLTAPAGSVEAGRQKKSIRSVGDFTGLEDIKNIVVAGGPKQGSSSQSATPGKDTGGWVYLRNVAAVQQGFKDQSQILRYNGKEAVGINIVKTGDANAIAVADNARAVIEEFNTKKLPAGAKMTVVTDSSEFTRQSVSAVQEDLILAILITGLVMLVFLHTIRSTFIVLLAIPTSIISTFLVMWALGFTLNTITLMALTLVIGILVDDSIVVIENIERHLRLKKKPAQAALDGRSEIGLAAITITLVDVVVYMPVAFTSGIVGQVFRSYGLTIAATTLFSLFVSFTLTPMLAAQWMKDESEPEEAPTGLRKAFSLLFKPVAWLWNGFARVWEFGFNALSNFYVLTLRIALRNILTQSLTVLIALAALVAGLFLVVSGVVPSEFFPPEDDGQFSVGIQMPAGTNLDATDQAARLAEQIVLKEVPETVAILTSVGSSGAGGARSVLLSGGGGSGDNIASITVRLVDKTQRARSVTAIVETVRPLVKKIPEADISVAQTSTFGGSSGGAISVQVTGDDMDKLIGLSNQVEAAIRGVPGTVDVLNTGAARSPETRIVINRDRALDLGLSPAVVASTLRTALSGSKSGTYKQTGATDVDITVRMGEAVRGDFNQLLRLPLGYRNGQMITLDQVSTIEDSQAPAGVSRTDRRRVLTITSGTSGRGSADVTNDIEAAIHKQVTFPAGYSFQFTGTSQLQRQSFADFGAALILSIVLVYMLLVALFQSWLHPLAIMASLPVALVGAFGGLWLFGNTLNMISILGIILLVGVVTKNAILLVDFTNMLRQERGYSRKAALVEAGRLRLRPILMTTAAIVFALLPLLFDASAGSELRAPLAAAVIGGNISSTLLTLILVPVVYNFFDGGSSLVTSVLRRMLGARKKEGAAEPGPALVPPKPAPAPQPGAAAATGQPAPQPDADAA